MIANEFPIKQSSNEPYYTFQEQRVMFQQARK